jgi:hypothetical protein
MTLKTRQPDFSRIGITSEATKFTPASWLLPQRVCRLSSFLGLVVRFPLIGSNISFWPNAAKRGVLTWRRSISRPGHELPQRAFVTGTPAWSLVIARQMICVFEPNQDAPVTKAGSCRFALRRGNEKAARRRLLNSTLMIVDQPAINDGFDFRWSAIKADARKPLRQVLF